MADGNIVKRARSGTMSLKAGVSIDSFSKTAKVQVSDNSSIKHSKSICYNNLPVDQKMDFDLVAFFGPKPGWRGENFGFDWLREGRDSVVPSNDHFAATLGKYYKSDGKTKVTSSDWNADFIFRQNDGLPLNEGDFSLLEQEYDATRMSAEPNVVKLYYVPWLSLMPGKVAELTVTFKIEKDAKYLKFDSNDHFEIIPMRFDNPVTGNTSVTIKCKDSFSSNQKLILRAYMDNHLGEEEHTVAGKINVWPNYRIIHEKILLISVKLEGEGKFVDAKEKDILKDILGQACIVPEIREHSLDFRNNEDFKKKFVRESVGNDQIRRRNLVFSSHLDNPILKTGDFDYLKELPGEAGPSRFLLNEVLDDEVNKNPEFQDYLQVFLFDLRMSHPDSGPGEYGVYLPERHNVLIYSPHSDITIAHEVLHSMGLLHTFNNAEAGKNKVRFTYRYSTTNNIMDYAHDCFTTFHWQWKVLHYRQALLKAREDEYGKV